MLLKEYYVRYLKKIRRLSDSSVQHYLNAINVISKFLCNVNQINTSIYAVTEIDELAAIMEFLYNNPEFVEKDERGHRMYSAGMNNYYRFACGEDFKNLKEEITLFDIEVPIRGIHGIEMKQWKRSSILKKQVIETAGYECELNSEHRTFIAKSTSQPYMEGHHLLPMRLQVYFNYSLDIYANVICLCPVCHRQMHYGLDNDRKNMSLFIYNGRNERLAKSGIRLSQDEFLEMEQ